jgi:lipid A oxidase
MLPLMQCLPLLALLAVVGGTASAEQVLSAYGGVQGALSGDVGGRDADGTRLDFEAAWEGRSFDPAPYYGLRFTQWLGDWGWSADFSHAKIYADEATLARSGFDRLEFTDGLNVLTLGGLRRFRTGARATPYFGAGIGISYPRVETLSPAAGAQTLEFQYGGPALELRAGIDWRMSPRWSVFGEYELNYVRLDVDMRGGGDFATDVIANAINMGVSFSFGQRTALRAPATGSRRGPAATATR